MNITIEAIEKVMEETGLEYKAAKELLMNAEGDADKAVRMCKQEIPEGGGEIDETIGKIKEMVKNGNVDRIQISKDGEILLSVPVNVGIVGGLIGMAAAPWALIAGAAAGFGLGCKFEVVKKDGSREDVV